jgi:hypothetical protein
MRRLASLSALGAGTMALGAGTAEADIVQVNVNQGIGFDSGFGSAPITVSLPGGAGLTLNGHSNITTLGGCFLTFHIQNCKVVGTLTFNTRSAGGKEVTARTPILSSEQMRLHIRQMGLQGTGVRFSGVYSKGGARGYGAASFVASRIFSTIIHRHFTASVPPFMGFHNTFTNPGSHQAYNNYSDPYRYFLFNFSDDGKTLYGWGQLDSSVSQTSGPDVTFVDYAYDTTGARIAPGETSAVPEPSETIPLALSALVLGAAGVRRWRKAQNPQA